MLIPPEMDGWTDGQESIGRNVVERSIGKSCLFISLSRLFFELRVRERQISTRVKTSFFFFFYSEKNRCKICLGKKKKICPVVDKFHRMAPGTKKNDTIFFNSVKAKWSVNLTVSRAIISRYLKLQVVST